MDAIKKPYRVFLLFLLLSAAVFCDEEDNGKEQEIECVNSCGDTAEEWKKCAEKCYGDFMDDNDKKFLSCETACVDQFYKPDVQESELGELEKCAEKCIDDYRGEDPEKKFQFVL